MGTELSPVYSTYEDSVCLKVSKSICDSRLARRFFSESNIRYLQSRARYCLGASKGDSLRIDDLIDATYAKVCDNGERDGVLDKNEDDFRVYESHVMKALYQNALNSKDDKNYVITYSRHWDSLTEDYDTGDSVERLDRTAYLQVEKGDGLDHLFMDVDMLVQECKACLCPYGISYVLVISAMCLYRECLNVESNSSSDLAQVSHFLQTLFGISAAETQVIHEKILKDANLSNLVAIGMQNPVALADEVRKTVRCGTFFDALESMLQVGGVQH